MSRVVNRKGPILLPHNAAHMFCRWREQNRQPTNQTSQQKYTKDIRAMVMNGLNKTINIIIGQIKNNKHRPDNHRLLQLQGTTFSKMEAKY